jgi:ribosome-binding factor A
MSIRTKRVAKLIQEELSYVFLREIDEPELEFVTITEVKVTPDLKIARVYFTTIDKSRREIALSKIEEIKSVIRKELARRVRNLRFIPELEFYIDTTQDYVEKMESLFEKIHETENKLSDENESEEKNGDE